MAEKMIVHELEAGALLTDKELVLQRQLIVRAMSLQAIYGWPMKRAVAQAMKECKV